MLATRFGASTALRTKQEIFSLSEDPLFPNSRILPAKGLVCSVSAPRSEKWPLFVTDKNFVAPTTGLEALTTPPAPTILLIDDNAIQAATRQTILKRAGYFVIAVLSPQRALEQFRNNEFPEDIDLVITDHVMPGMSGSAFVEALRQIAPTLPVLVISGLEEAEPEYAGLNVMFRLKPLLPDYLLASVHFLVHEQPQIRNRK